MFANIRDLTSLAVSCAKVANHFYQSNGQPHPDRIYREHLPAVNALAYVPLSELVEDKSSTSNAPILRETVRNQKVVEWLVSHGVNQIAHYTGGNSATVSIARRDDGHVFAIRRISKPEDNKNGRVAAAFDAAQNRLEVPLVLQPFDRFSFSYVNNDPYSTRSTMLLELLPVVPVFPNGMASIDVSDGHPQFHEEKISGVPGFREDEESLLEGRKLTFVSVVKASGFQISRVADIGILPDGTPVFVDPDVIKKATIAPTEALRRLEDYTASLALSDFYSWQDRNGMSKQISLFPSTPFSPQGGLEGQRLPILAR